jgi:vancomycin resistance protein YoaR
VTDEPYNDRRVIPWLLVGLIVLFGGVYVAGYFFTSDRVPRGTTISGVDIGGMRPAAAETALEEQLSETAAQPIPVVAGDVEARIRPAAAGLTVDVPASVEQAGGGRSWNPARMWDALTGGDRHEVVLAVDTAALEASLDGIAAEVETEPRDGRVVFRADAAVAREARPGQALDRAAAADAVEAAYLDRLSAEAADGGASADPVELPVEVRQPEVSDADVSAAMDDFANPAVSGPVSLRLDGERVTLRPRDFVPALSMAAEDGDLLPQLDEKVLVRRVEARVRPVVDAPEDATVRLVDGRPRVVPGQKGVTFDRDELTGGFLDVLTERGAARTIRVATVVDDPDFTTRDARRLNIDEVVSEFTTNYPHSDYRNTNLGRAAELIDGTVLKPGDVFSLNGVVGERTEENGFAKGFIISDGVFKEDFGGGVSQVATTTFNAMFFAGLKDIEHKPHSFYIDRYPVGREATVAWPYVDLRFQNDTEHGVLIEAGISPSSPGVEGSMTVRMWSTKTWRIEAEESDRYAYTEPATRQLSGEDCVPNEGYGGFTIDVYRLFYRPGSDELERRERFNTVYTPSDSVVCS